MLEEEFDRRSDLRDILLKERRKNKAEVESKDYLYFHPSDNEYFNKQEKAVLNDIRALLDKIEGLKLFTSGRGLNLSSMKYKISE